MKKIISVFAAMLILAFGAQAQSAKEMAKDRQQLNNVLKKSLEAKPTKDAKKQAKEYKKEGWVVPVGEPTLEQQIMRSMYVGAELTADDEGIPSNRFFQHTSYSTAGSYNAAYAACRANAQTEISNMLGAELAAAVQTKLDNDQDNAVSAVTVDKFNQRMRTIVNQNLTNSFVTVVMYRHLPNNNFEVSVRLAYDKNEVKKRVKNALQKELELEGDELMEIVDSSFANSGL